MGCCGSKSAGKSTFDKARDAMNEMILEKKASGLELNAEIMEMKQAVRGLEEAVDESAKMFAAWAGSTKGVLQMPSLAVWSAEPTFVGSAAAAKVVHDLAAQQFELAMLESGCRKEDGMACVAELEAAGGLLTGALKSCNQYIEAEINVNKKSQALASAQGPATRCKAAWEEAAAAEAKAEEEPSASTEAELAAKKKAAANTKKAWETAEAAREKAEAAHQTAVADLDLAREAALKEVPEKRQAAEKSISDGFTKLRTGYERINAAAKAMQEKPEVFAEAFAAYQPKSGAGGESGGSPAAGEDATREQRVTALRNGAQSAAARSTSAMKQLRTWQKSGLKQALGPRTNGAHSEKALLTRLAGAMEGADSKAAVEGAILEEKDQLEATFSDGACSIFCAAVEMFKASLDDTSNRAASWLAESKKAEETRKKLGGKADATAEERAQLKFADEKLASEYDALVAIGTTLASEEAVEGSVQQQLVAPLRQLLGAMTEHVTARPLCGLYKPPEGGETPRAQREDTEVRGEDEVEADAAEAEELQAAESRRLQMLDQKQSSRDVRFGEAERMREATKRTRQPGAAFQADDVPDLLDDIQLDVEVVENGGAEAEAPPAEAAEATEAAKPAEAASPAADEATAGAAPEAAAPAPAAAEDGALENVGRKLTKMLTGFIPLLDNEASAEKASGEEKAEPKAVAAEAPEKASNEGPAAVTIEVTEAKGQPNVRVMVDAKEEAEAAPPASLQKKLSIVGSRLSRMLTFQNLKAVEDTAGGEEKEEKVAAEEKAAAEEKVVAAEDKAGEKVAEPTSPSGSPSPAVESTGAAVLESQEPITA